VALDEICFFLMVIMFAKNYTSVLGGTVLNIKDNHNHKLAKLVINIFVVSLVRFSKAISTAF